MSQTPLPRRDFLKLVWGALATGTAVGVGYIGLRFLASRVGQGDFGGPVTAGPVEDFPPGTVTPFVNGQFYLVRQPDGGFLALYRKCTHLDCVVLWDEAAGRFHCPCHGSLFEPDGRVLNPPAPRPLVRFPITFEDGKVVVDTGTLIERAATSPEDAAYPTPTAGPGATP
jgi:cytochrome b6-f complex iron-sulfur subunit